jgi:predicted  nucleic acid-binding Zn-ribbon protein
MRTPIDQLYRLQQRIRFVQTRQRERDTVPPELTDVDREFRDKVDAVGRIRERLTEAEGEHRRAEGELAEARDRLKRYQTQLRSVQTSREYGAVLNEIDGVEKQVRSIEDRVLGLEEEIETAQQDLSGREERLPRETEEHEEKIKDWRATQRRINEELTDAEREIHEIEAAIDPRERSEFYRLLEKKGGLAVVPAVNGSCSACHVKIRPAALQSLKGGREIVYCDTCKRILYYDHQGGS